MTICTLTVRDGLPDWCEECRRYHHGHQRKWAIGNDPTSVAKRAKWRALANGATVLPETNAKAVPFTSAQMVASYLETLKRHIAGGRLMVPDDVKQARRDACNRCEYRDTEKDACKICRCNLSPSELEATIIGDKLRWAVAQCPLPEPAWTEYTGSS